MLILLPPSEGKKPADSGAPFDAEDLQFPALNPHRQQLLSSLAEVSRADDALKVLAVGKSLVADVVRNIELHTEPSAPAHTIYTGVLFEALGYDRLDAAARKRADADILVISALWGAVGFGDRIPAYRLSMSVKLPEIGKLASWWKPKLTPVLNERAGDGLVVDCRSSTYAAAWTPPAENTVAVSVFQLRGGVRKVVSHFAKHTRGELAGHLLTRGVEVETPEELLEAASERWEAELVPGTGRKPHQLNIILPEDHAFKAVGN
ncbi:peroxide stress protein YaaA [Paeniglutamicibacter gangotriensis]|uniref:Peroxide stress protein YaaA n=1 Tax=Paeniglutamicibacter gangotriensis TaxID=254787 RepID=A0A5B0EBS7_9MICC|nr:peroxide stress protein YaaA [Paeniglutamicibacter gangotriensis]KAA0976484.1 peroxide stress protein YaaA [Paeniglutamicibacter gangotriensis]